MTALLMVCAPRASIIFNALHPAMKAVTELSPRFYGLGWVYNKLGLISLAFLPTSRHCLQL
jgi:hypothetical protein